MEGHAKPQGDMSPPWVNDSDLPDEMSSVPTVEERWERMLIWKIDLHILPVVVLLYLFSFLDRGSWSDSPCFGGQCWHHPLVNIGNARLYGLEEDLGLVGDQYQIAVSILFVTYCVCQVHQLIDTS